MTIGNAGGIGREACPQGRDVRQSAGLRDRLVEALGKFGLAAAIMRQRQEFDDGPAGLPLGQLSAKRLEGRGGRLLAGKSWSR